MTDTSTGAKQTPTALKPEKSNVALQYKFSDLISRVGVELATTPCWDFSQNISFFSNIALIFAQRGYIQDQKLFLQNF